MKPSRPLFLPRLRAVLLPLAGAASMATAATTDLASSPLFTSSASSIKPNIYFILDDSGSMARDYIPDDASAFDGKYGDKASQCNGLAYNPTVVYTPPVNSNGTSVGNASTTLLIADPVTNTDTPRSVSGPVTMPASASGTITITVNASNRKNSWYEDNAKITVYTTGDPNRWFSGYVNSWNKDTGALKITLTGGTVVGSGSFANPRVAYGWVNVTEYYTYSGTQTRLGYTYTSSGVVTTTDFYKECNSAIGSTPGRNVFTRVTLTESSPSAQNYANWYQYYRTRMTMMKSATSLAFRNIDNRYRIGYSTISKETAAEDDDFLNIRDFDTTQKSSFYTKMNTATPNSNTPLRGALSKAGQYFANKARSQTVDPMQYSCQRNFTILSTDGYWNTGDESATSPKYGPYKLDNSTAVGQQDGGTTQRPMYDGQGASSTTTDNTLADVAAYYYNTDLRDASLSNCDGAITGVSVCTNNVPTSKGDAAHSFGDPANWQHMTTFTLGLGVAGLLRFDPNYQSQQSGDFYDILNGAKNWPTPGSTKGPENVDDLWHAAVNGHGQYFSAGDPASLLSSLTSALNNIEAKVGSASAASTSSLHPVQGDNDVYVAQFTTQKWIGDVLSYQIDPDTGAITTTPTWSAAAKLNLKNDTNRTIFYRKPDGSQTPRDFTYANLNTDSLLSNFTNFCSKTSASGSGVPGQCATLADTTAANDANNLVAYLRGNKTKDYYREREGLLGDIINASPLFVGKPSFKYSENDYATYASNNAGRQGIVLAASNDGMVHAFKREDGTELWAYIPSFVIPNLYKLADTNFTNNHSYFVDGSPQVADVYDPNCSATDCPTTKWKTIVVGGLNKGGRGYYALDVTNPTSPKILWETSSAAGSMGTQYNNLGLTYGNPVITKRTDGTWVVVFGSGYNNVSPGDGNGHLFVLNAITGALVKTVDTYTSGTTPAGDTTTPSGLSKINVWVDSDTNNIGRRFYGGDLLGNVWRFDIDSQVQPYNAALRLAQLTNTATPTAGAQSVTTTPALAEVLYNGVRYPVVYVTTGRYLGVGDLSDTTKQSVYAIKDPLTSTGLGVLRTNTNIVTQTATVNTDASRAITPSTVNWATGSGWRLDFPESGERVNVNPTIVLKSLVIGTNVPNVEACSVGGTSYIYNLDILTGGAAEGETSAGYSVGDVLVQGLTVVQLKDGSTETLITRSDAKLQTERNQPPSSGSTPRRTSWRELAD